MVMQIANELNDHQHVPHTGNSLDAWQSGPNALFGRASGTATRI